VHEMTVMITPNRKAFSRPNVQVLEFGKARGVVHVLGPGDPQLRHADHAAAETPIMHV